MWARISELVFGFWLAASPFIFQHPSTRPEWWWNDLVTAALTLLVVGISCLQPLRHWHLWQLAIGAWLVGFGYFTGPVPDPPQVIPAAASQNQIFVGLLLLMFGLLPTRAKDPPPRWAEFAQAEGRGVATPRP